MRKRLTNHYPCQNIITKRLSKLLGVEVWAEWRFHEKRLWRFDYAIPAWKIAVEQDGGLYSGGRHSGGDGQLHDMEKMNEAAMHGWIVLHYTPAQFRHYSKVAQDIIRAYEAKGTLDTGHDGSVHQSEQKADDTGTDKASANINTRKK